MTDPANAADEALGLGVYSSSEGDVLRNGIPLHINTTMALVHLYEARPDAYAHRQAKRLKAAIRLAQQYHESEAA